MPSETLSDISELWLDECFEHAMPTCFIIQMLCVWDHTKYCTSPAGLPEFMSWLSRANLFSLSCPSFRELIFPFSSSVILYACIGVVPFTEILARHPSLFVPCSGKWLFSGQQQAFRKGSGHEEKVCERSNPKNFRPLFFMCPDGYT